MFAPDGQLLRADGRTAHGIDQVRVTLEEYLSQLRATTYEVSSEWNPDPGVWIAQLAAHYELADYGRYGPYRRVFILRAGPEGILGLAIYGAHEMPLAATNHSYSEVYGDGRWMPTL